MNRRNWRRHYKWFRYIIPVIVTIVPATLPPIAPGCDQYGPACVIDTTAGDPPPPPVVVIEGDNPEPLTP